MSVRRILLVARRDLAEIPRRPLYLLWAVFLAWNGYLISRGAWFYRSVDTSVGTQVSWVNSEFQIAFVMALIGFLIVAFFVALAAGMPLIRDATWRVGELLHATPLKPGEYVWGKFLAAFAGILAVVGVMVLSAIAFSHVPPDTETLDAYAPFQLRSYLLPTVVFLLPAVAFVAGAAFALGAFFSRAILVFLLPVSSFLFYQTVFWSWYPEDIDPFWTRALQLADPSGFRWLKQNWLVVDRGIAFYNTTPIDYDAGFLASRLGFVVLGLALVVWTSRHVAGTLRGKSSPQPPPFIKEGEPEGIPPVPVPPFEKGGLGGISSEDLGGISPLRMRSKPPGLLRGAWTVARFELAELFAHPGLYIFLPIVFFLGLIVLQVAAEGLGSVFNPPILVTSGGAAAITLTSLNFWMAFLLLFYAVESLRRESETRIESIYFATPVRTVSVLAGKTVANAAVMLAIMLATFAAVSVVLARQPQVAFDWRPFAIVWGLLFTPTFLLWIAFVTAAYAATGSRYTTYGIGLGAIALTGWWFSTGDMTWLTNWPLATILGWSDVSVFELDRAALVLNRLTVLGLAAVLATLAVALYRRRDGDPLVRRPAGRRRLMGIAAALCLVPLATGFLLWREVHAGFQGDAVRQRQKDYWRQNHGTWGTAAAGVTLPEIVHVDLDLDLEPSTRSFHSAGFYDLVNRTGEPLPWLPVTGGFFWQDLEWTLDGRPATPEERSGLYLFRLDEPLAPAATLRLRFRYRGELAPGPTRNGVVVDAFEFMLPAGVVVTGRNPDFVPVIGYQPAIGVDEDNRFESRIYPRDFYRGVTAGDTDRSWFTHRLRISAPAEYTVNSTGALAGVEERGGRKTWTWETDYPVRVFNVIAGRWDVRRGDGTAVFYDARHPFNVDSMLAALDGARRYYSEWYYPYPWHELRLSEFPAVARYARGNATNIFFSEAVGFLTAPNPRLDLAFTIAAHESAHSWWGHVVGNGAGPGGIVLSEGGADFATMMLLEEVRGPLARQHYARQLERLYGENRQVTSEEPLAETDYDRGFADAVVIYNKGSWALWMLLDHMGREAFLDGVREYFRLYHRKADHPVIQDFVAVLRPYAQDPEAFDRFVEQWFFEVVAPEYRIAALEKKPLADACADCSWSVRAEVLNAGTGTMPVDVAAVRGRRFADDGSASPDYRDCRGELTLGAGETGTLELTCPFEPERVVVDPDVMVLQLQRTAASVRFR